MLPESKTNLVKSQSFDSAYSMHLHKSRNFRHRELPYKTSPSSHTSPSESWSPSSMSLSLASLNLSNISTTRVRRSSSTTSNASSRRSSTTSNGPTSSLRTLFSTIKTKIHKNHLSSNDVAQNLVVETKIKSKWRPTIKFIYNDEELLQILIEFMTKQYNEENILFLISVDRLEKHITNLLELKSEINIVEQKKF